MNLILELMGWAGTELGREFCDCKEGGGEVLIFGVRKGQAAAGSGGWGLGVGVGLELKTV